MFSLIIVTPVDVTPVTLCGVTSTPASPMPVVSTGKTFSEGRWIDISVRKTATYALFGVDRCPSTFKGLLTSPRYFVAIYNWSKVLPGSLQGKERKR